MTTHTPCPGPSVVSPHTSPQRIFRYVVTSVVMVTLATGCTANSSTSRGEVQLSQKSMPVPTDSDPSQTVLATEVDGSETNGGDASDSSAVDQNNASVSSSPSASTDTSLSPTGSQPTTTSRPNPSANATSSTTIARSISGGPPPGPPPTTNQPPPSPPLIGPQTTTTTVFIGPTIPSAPTTTIDTGPFRCTVRLSWSTTQGRRLVVNVLGANRPTAWVVLNWPGLPIRFDLELENGDGGRSISTSETQLPAVRVFEDDFEDPAGLGCQQI